MNDHSHNAGPTRISAQRRKYFSMPIGTTFRSIDITLAVLLAGLLFIWSVPHTIALRHLLIVLLGLALLSTTDRTALKQVSVDNWLALGALGILTVWLVIQAVVISPEPAWALGELKSQWLLACIALLLGLGIGVTALKSKGFSATWVIAVLTGVIMLQTLIALGQSIWHWHLHGNLLRQIVPITGGKLEMSFILNILLAILTVELFFRALRKKGLIPAVPLPLLVCGASIALFSAYLAGARNGIIGLAFLAVTSIILFLFSHRKSMHPIRLAVIIIFLVTALFGFLAASYKADSRWQTFAETVAIAWDIDHHHSWLDRKDYPKLQDGETVDISTYERVAWIHAGSRQIAENPLGIGYGRSAFAHALRPIYGLSGGGHSHSGFIDFTLGGGIPALLLWLFFVGSLFVASWRSYSRSNNPYGLLLFFLISGYTGRMLLDSVQRDHMLQIFMFLVGFLMTQIRISPVWQSRQNRHQ